MFSPIISHPHKFHTDHLMLYSLQANMMSFCSTTTASTFEGRTKRFQQRFQGYLGAVSLGWRFAVEFILALELQLALHVSAEP
jgi:hypothetical protein